MIIQLITARGSFEKMTGVFRNVEIVNARIQNRYANELNESPVIKYRDVIFNWVFNGRAARIVLSGVVPASKKR